MSRGLIVFFAFFGVFVAGSITGGVIALRMQPSVAHRGAAERFTDLQFKRVAEELALTPEQRDRIRPMVTTAGREIQGRRREILLILQRMEAELRGQLTESQRSKYDGIRAQQRENQHPLREQRGRRLERVEQRNGLPSTTVPPPAPTNRPGESSTPLPTPSD